ncbi:MAG: CysB family HTH-type transcriptional regulator [Azoarcus sp.]|jgi:LysR family cys regulon transcriptional activator|nr:CysB family HTH-type transcriptional regulator [Azoarcus sp.]
MNFQQLRIVRETVRRGFNLTAVGNALFTSQSGVSKHIKDLEDEIGLELFVRRGKRLLGLTEPGKEVAAMVERMLLDATNIKRLAEQYASADSGQLTVATTHTQARYALPQVVTAFKRAYPRVHLKLHQGSPAEIVQMLLDGEADIGIATEAIADIPDLVSFPYYSWRHIVVVPVGHPLAEMEKPALADVAEYPIITYHEGITGRARIDNTFAAAGLAPEIVMSALDADVIKSYVELGLGVGIIAPMAFDPARDIHLVRLETDAPLFAENVSRIAARRGQYLRGFAYRFMEFASPELTEERVIASLAVDASTIV